MPRRPIAGLPEPAPAGKLSRITYRELEGLLSPLLNRRSDLTYEKGFLFLVPFTHYARGAVFEISIYSKRFEAFAFASQIFGGDQNFQFWGNEGRPMLSFGKEWTERPEETSQSLCAFLEEEVLPDVEAIVNPTEHEKRLEYMPRFLPDGDPFSSSFYTFGIALGRCFEGDFAAAEAVLARWSTKFPEYPVESATEEKRYHDFFLWRMSYLLKTLRKDADLVPKLLHDWQDRQIESMGLKKRNWKREPFPCEQRH
jgi:hypothetical protein